MTLSNLIEQLQDMRDHGVSGNAVVRAFDPDSAAYEEVTGMLCGTDGVTLQTDEVD